MQINYYHKLLVVAAVGLFYSNFLGYMYDRQGWTVITGPTQWTLLFCLFSLPVVLRQTTTWNALKSPVTIWCCVYACLTVLWFFQSSQSEVAWSQVRWRFASILQILAFLVVFWESGATRLARNTLVLAVLIGVVLNIYEFFAPMTFSQVLGRSAGLYLNSNMSAEALVLGMILGVTALEPRYRGLFVLLTGTGVLLTLSRAGILAWLIAVAGIILVGTVRLKDLVLVGSAGMLLVTLILLPRWDQLLTTLENTGMMNTDVVERLAWFTDPAGVSDRSSWGRVYVARRAWEEIVKHPFLGSGTGASDELAHETGIKPHNQYLSFMMDHGILGVTILPLLILAAIWGTRGETRQIAIVFGCTVMMLSLFTHTILNIGYTIILFSMMAAMAARGGQREIQRMAVTDTSEAEAVHVLGRA